MTEDEPKTRQQMINVKVGDRIKCVPETFCPDWELSQEERFARANAGDWDHLTAEGIVTYVHPSGRYYTVEFDLHGKKIHESFTPDVSLEAFMVKREFNRKERLRGKK